MEIFLFKMNITIGFGISLVLIFIGVKAYRNKFIQALVRRMRSYFLHTPAVKQTINQQHKVVSLEYEKDNKIYHLHLPYEPTQRSKGLSKRVFLKNKHETKEITQYPGIAYLLTAQQMGGYEIQIFDEDTEEVSTLSSEEKIKYE